LLFISENEATLVARQARNLPLLNGDFLFLYLSSNALLDEDGDSSTLLWKIEKEGEAFWQLFSATHNINNITFKSAPASTFELTFGSTNPKIIHFSGHGFEADDGNDMLAFEYHFEPFHKKLGSICPLTIKDVEEIYKQFEGSKPELVCLCACHSELIGEAFLRNGVHHVIAIKRFVA
jgi:CHAT domain-containing protein